MIKLKSMRYLSRWRMVLSIAKGQKGNYMRFEKMSDDLRFYNLKRLNKCINKHCFNNELEEAEIDMCEGDEMDFFAIYYHPTIYHHYHEILVSSETIDRLANYNTIKKQEEALFIIVLHEMVHQYCYENGINDDDHNENFIDACKHHGLMRYQEVNGSWAEKLSLGGMIARSYFRFLNTEGKR